MDQQDDSEIVQDLIDYQESEIERKSSKLEELELIQELVEEDENVSLSQVGGGYFELSIQLNEMNNEYKNLLSFSVVENSPSIHYRGNDPVIEAALEYDPQGVYNPQVNPNDY